MHVVPTWKLEHVKVLTKITDCGGLQHVSDDTFEVCMYNAKELHWVY